MSKTITIETPPPRNAMEAVHFAIDKFRKEELDLTSTAGITNNTKAIWKAIDALAMYVDGVANPITHQIVVPDGYVSPDGAPVESRPVVARDPSSQVVVA